MSNDREVLDRTGNDSAPDSTGNAKHGYSTAWRELLERNLLNCAYCRKPFNNGAYAVQKEGNVCKECLVENGWKGERQEIFDVILENVATVPCFNASKGCQELFLPEDLDSHLEYCKLRQVKCVSQGCSWEGKQDELVVHFKKQHKADVIHCATFNFNLEIASRESFVVSKLLIKPKFKYLFVVERKLEPDMICYRLYAIDEAEPRRVTVRHIFNNQRFDVEINTILLNMIDKECTATEVDLKTLNATLGQNNSYLIIVQVPVNKAEQVLKILECPSCLETMKPPIYLCTRGHSICSACSSKSSVCLICNGNINTQLRVNSLEALTTDLFYSCVNKGSGCKDLILGCDVEKHESKCIYTTYACHLNNCTFKIDYGRFKQHVKDEHGDVLQANEHFYRFKLGNHFDKKVDMFVNGCFFLVTYKYGANNGYPNLTYTVSLVTKNPVSDHYCNIVIRNSEDQREMRFIHKLTDNQKPVSSIIYKTYHFDSQLPGVTDLIFCVKIYKSNQ